MPIGWGPASEMTRTVNKQRKGSVKRSLKESSDSTLPGENLDKPLKFKEATPEQLEEIRTRLQKENKQKVIIAASVIALILLSAVIFSSLV